MQHLRSRSLLRVGLCAFLIAIAFARDDNSRRIESIASKMYCNCGCGQMLSECAHAQCKRKAALKEEIDDAIAKGDSDSAVLKEMGAKYGATILAAPPFQGFNVLLWLLPFVFTAIAIAILIVRWKKRTTVPEQHE